MAIDGRTFRLQRTIASAIAGDRTALDGPELPLENPPMEEAGDWRPSEAADDTLVSLWG